MALSTATPAVFHELVGETFVRLYYRLLQNQPELLHYMYEESSKLSLPDANGVMASVTTKNAINDALLSCDYYKGCEVKYETVDSHLSQNGEIWILVTGYLTGPEKIKRKFCQTIFLATKQDGKSYIILNDMFRFIDDAQPKQVNKDIYNTAPQPLVGVPENSEEVHCTSEMGNAVVEQKLSAEPASKTYASIVRERTLPLPVHVTEPEKLLGVSTNPASNVRGHSVYVRNLPWNATVSLLEREFTNFGRIVPGGVQVKWNQVESYCYGFVEFEEHKSMQDALMASPVTVAGRDVIIEKKKTSVRVRNGIVVSGRPKQFRPKSVTRNEIYRGNGDFVRNISSERGNFSALDRFQGFPPHNWMQPNFFHNGDVRMRQQGFYQNGNGRMGQVHDYNFQNGDGMVGQRRMYM